MQTLDQQAAAIWISVITIASNRVTKELFSPNWLVEVIELNFQVDTSATPTLSFALLYNFIRFQLKWNSRSLSFRLIAGGDIVGVESLRYHTLGHFCNEEAG